MAAVGAHLACSLAIPFLATQVILSSCPRRSLQMSGPCPSASDATGLPTHSFARSPLTTRSRECTCIVSSVEHRAFNASVTLHRAQWSSQSQSRVYSTSWSQLREFSGIIPSRCARNSSGRTDVLLSTSTRSIAIVGTSARSVRRSEFAKARSIELSLTSTRNGSA